MHVYMYTVCTVHVHPNFPVNNFPINNYTVLLHVHVELLYNYRCIILCIRNYKYMYNIHVRVYIVYA